MKRLFILLFSLLLCVVSYADTINLHWLNYDGTTYQDSTCVVDSDLILPATPPTRYGYTFTGWKLSNYIPIEYIESTGTQWIDTGLVFNKTTVSKITEDFTIQYMNHCSTHGFNWGISGINDNNYNLCLVQRNWSSEEYIVIDSSSSIGKINITNVDISSKYHYIYDIDLQNNILTLTNNDTVSSQAISGGQIPRTSANNIVLFKCHNSISSNPGIRIYNYKFYFNNILVRDFIPVLDTNGVPCLLDKVKDVFYYNEGTGNFIAGPVLQQ